MVEQTTGPQAAKPRTYTDEYRRQVVDMVTATGRTAMSVAAELAETRSVCGCGIHHTLIPRWMRWYGRTGGGAAEAVRPTPAVPLLKPIPVPHADQAAEAKPLVCAEIARLKRENERLRMERDILKKGIAIFANPSR